MTGPKCWECLDLGGLLERAADGSRHEHGREEDAHRGRNTLMYTSTVSSRREQASTTAFVSRLIFQ